MKQQLQKKKDNQKKGILEQGFESDEEIMSINRQRPKRKCTNKRRKKEYSYDETSPDRYFDKETGRKVKAAKPTKMPAKLVYKWEKSEPIPEEANKRRTSPQHYPVQKIKKLWEYFWIYMINL